MKILKKIKQKLSARRATGWINTKLEEVKANIRDLNDVDIVNKVSDEDINAIRQQLVEIQDFIGDKGDVLGNSTIIAALNGLNTDIDNLNSHVQSELSYIQIQINDITSRLTADETIITNNTQRINQLENDLIAQTTDDAKLTGADGQITSTQTQVTNISIEEGFDNDDNVEVEIDDITGLPTGWGIVKKNMNITLTTKATVETTHNGIINVTCSVKDDTETLSEETTSIDFSGSLTIGNQSQIILTKYRDIDPNDESTFKKVGIFFNTDGETINTSNIKFFIAYTTIGEVTGTTKFEEVSNDTNVAGANGKEVINNLNDKINSFDNVYQVMYDMLHPLGTVIMLEGTDPNDELTNGVIATWQDLEVLEDGQAIIGGKFDSIGVVRRHSHQWARGGIYQSLDAKNEEKALIQIQTYDAKGEYYDTPYYGNGGADGTNKFNAYTAEEVLHDGSEHTLNLNKAYGKGIGENVKIWKRIL